MNVEAKSIIEQWWKTTGLNLSHKDACIEAFNLGMSVVSEDYRLARGIERRRAVNPDAQPSPDELRAIDNILIQQARERLSTKA